MAKGVLAQAGCPAADGSTGGSVVGRPAPPPLDACLRAAGLDPGDPTRADPPGGDAAAWPRRLGLGGGFPVERHQRLSCDRRGLLGCCRAGGLSAPGGRGGASAPATDGGEGGLNGPQFFVTLGPGGCPWLDAPGPGQVTVFGRVVGASLYRLSRLDDVETVEGADRPASDRVPGAADGWTDGEGRRRTGEPRGGGDGGGGGGVQCSTDAPTCVCIMTYVYMHHVLCMLMYFVWCMC